MSPLPEARKHRYGPARSNFAELYLPDAPGPHPVAVVIHGGFWKAHFSLKLMRDVCADLAERGWAAWNLEYRRLGLGNGGGYPTTCEDVAAGIDHLADLGAIDRPHAIELDLTRVVAIGHSAGGHLALWAATRESPRVPLTKVAGQAALTDLVRGAELGLSRGVIRRFLGDHPLEAASPIERVPLGIPVLLTHGAEDDVVPPELSERFADRAREAGDEVALRVFEGGDHMGHIVPGNPMWEAVAEWI